MKKILITVLMVILVFGLASSAKASVTFTFDSLTNTSTIAQIEAYMEGLYGSDITVTTAKIATDAPINSPHLQDSQGGGSGSGTHAFSIAFNVVPITSVSFDWGTQNDPFYFLVDSNPTPFFSSSAGNNSGNTGVINFGTPVTTLYFHDSDVGRIMIDNLVVTPNTTGVPEPATLSLLGLGLVGLLKLKGGTKCKKV